MFCARRKHVKLKLTPKSAPVFSLGRLLPASSVHESSGRNGEPCAIWWIVCFLIATDQFPVDSDRWRVSGGSRKSNYGVQGVWGCAASGGAGGQSPRWWVWGQSPLPRSWSIIAFCVMVKAFSWIPKCKNYCIMYNLARVWNYAREIIQASKDVSVGCRWYQSRFNGSKCPQNLRNG